MQGQPLLSIIIPTFNSALTIQRCLTSLCNQVFRDFELLIIDGRSKDNTLEIVREFQECGQTIKIFSESDDGTYDAMNKGIQMSIGSWLYFLGSDDWLYNEYVLQNVFTNKENLSFDILYGNVFRTGLDVIYDGPFDERKFLQKNICHQAIFFRRAVFKMTGFYNTKYKVLSDWDNNIKWFYNTGITKKHIDLVIANYTDHGKSSIEEDETFQAEKFLNIYKYSFNHLNKEMKLLVLRLIIYSYAVRRKYIPAFRFITAFAWDALKRVFKGKVVFN